MPPFKISPSHRLASAFFIFATLALLISWPAQAQSTSELTLTDEQDEYRLDLYVDMLEDARGELTIDDIISPEISQQFRRNEMTNLNPGLTESIYWVRLKINNQSSYTGLWWLEIANEDILEATLYYPHPDGRPGYMAKMAGDNVFSDNPETYHYFIVFGVPLSPQTEQTIFLRIDSRRLELPLTLWSSDGFIRESQQDFAIMGLYLGVLAIMAGYNTFLFFALRDRSYIYYVLFVFFLLLANLLRNRLLLATPLAPWIGPGINLVIVVVATATFVFLLQFTISFLVLNRYAARLYQISRGLQVALIVSAVLYILFRQYSIIIGSWLIFIIATMLTVFITGLVVWRQGFKPARFFVLALGLISAAVTVAILGVLGVFPTTYTEYFVQLGVILMTLVFSLALADRINLIKDEHEKAQAEVVHNQEQLLFLQDEFAGTLQDKNEELLQTVAERQAAEAETQQRNRELTLLNRVISTTTAAVDAQTVLDAACRELTQALDLQMAMASVRVENEERIEIVIDYPPRENSFLGRQLSIKDDPLTNQIIATGAPLVLENAHRDQRITYIKSLMEAEGVVTLAFAPLFFEERFVGGLCLGSDIPQRFGELELDLLERVAAQVAGALARIRLVEDRQRLEEQYFQAQKMEAIGQLTAGIAHDFNNLLTAITGYASLMQHRLDDDNPNQKTVGKILHAGDRATRLVSQLMAFSRKQVVEPRPVNMNQVIIEMGDMLRRVLGEDITLITELDSNLAWTQIDPAQFDQIIVNMAVNARDAMPNGGRLTIATQNTDLDENFIEGHLGVAAGAYVQLTISDTGRGMSSAVKERIFEPFFTTKERGKGTGLGLATVFGIVKQNEGDIWVYSEEGIGTTFKIYLPQIDVPISAADQPAAPPADLRGEETILLAEDDDQVRDLAQQVLEMYGYTVLAVDNGQKALATAAEYPGQIDLLVTDVIMPNMNGKDLADHLNQARPSLKVLYMSGYTEDIFAHHNVLDAEVHLLHKPFSAVSLAQAVRHLLNLPSTGAGHKRVNGNDRQETNHD